MTSKGGIATDDNTILRRLKKQDAAALEAAVTQYGAYVAAVIENQLGSFAVRQDVEELASDTFVALWQSAGTITSGRLRGWLGHVARNRAVSFLRKQHLRFAQQEDVFCVDDRDAQRLLEEKERRALVQQALLTLSDEDRELMLRRYFYNQSAEQIAREKDMNPGTVRSRLCRARQAMKAALEKGGIRFEDLCAEAL